MLYSLLCGGVVCDSVTYLPLMGAASRDYIAALQQCKATFPEAKPGGTRTETALDSIKYP
jgi:hypothetical protein